jgi:hypothetical protein
MATECKEGSPEQSSEAINPTLLNNASLIEGYPKLAGHMGNFPETAIMRRFSTLNSQNLLYMQAEIFHLENELRELEMSNSKSQDTTKHMYARDWYWLKHSGEEGDGAQWEAVLKIREKLKDYSMVATCA